MLKSLFAWVWPLKLSQHEAKFKKIQMFATFKFFFEKNLTNEIFVSKSQPPLKEKIPERVKFN